MLWDSIDSTLLYSTSVDTNGSHCIINEIYLQCYQMEFASGLHASLVENHSKTWKMQFFPTPVRPVTGHTGSLNTQLEVNIPAKIIETLLS